MSGKIHIVADKARSPYTVTAVATKGEVDLEVFFRRYLEAILREQEQE